MAHTGAEFFTSLRCFASNLDKACNELKAKNESEEESTFSEGRAHLILSKTLSDVQTLKKDVKNKVHQVKGDFSFGDVLDACQKLSEHTKTQIDELQSHLCSYGYIPVGLPPVSDTVKQQSSSEVLGQDDDNDSCQSNDDDACDTSTNENNCKTCQDDDDNLMDSPVRPVTLTKLYDMTPQQEAGNSSDNDDFLTTPVKPVLLTKMFDFTPKNANRRIEIQDAHIQDSPIPPVLKTPNLKMTGPHRHGSSVHIQDSPIPPVLKTPNLKMTGPRRHGSSVKGQPFSPDSPIDPFASPDPPTLICSYIRETEDIPKPKNKIDENIEEKYVNLPNYLQNLFTVDDIQQLVQQINGYLDENGCNSLSEETLNKTFNLGGRTKALMIILSKLGKAQMINGGLGGLLFNK